MSFLKGIGGANSAAGGLGHLIGADPSRISSIANSIGGVANSFASAGGATPGYAAPQQPAVNNHLQMLDPEVLRAILAKFGNGGGTAAPGYAR